MNKQRLQDIAHHISNVTENEIVEIKQLIAKYPFYSLPHMVLAKIFYVKEHYLFENALTQAAMRVKDREWLYKFIHDEKSNFRVDGIVNNASNESEVIEMFEEQPEIIIANGQPMNEIESSEYDDNQDTDSIETKNNLSEFLDDNEFVPIETTYNEIDESQSSEIIAQAEEVEVIHQNQTEDTIHNESEIFENELANNESNDDSENTEVLNIAMNLRKHPVYNVETFLKIAELDDESTGETKDFFYWLSHPKKKDQEVKKEIEIEVRSDEKLSIIDQFIKANPAISRPKKEFFSAENMAKRSEDLNLDFVSETLANIYYEQGNIDLALEAYEKLSLQNPLKQTYFATLIEKIKKEKR